MNDRAKPYLKEGDGPADPAGDRPGRPATVPEGLEADGELATLAKAVGHPARIRILRLLAASEQSICGELVAALPFAQSTVSQHLKVLKDAGLVRADIDGPRTRYRLEPQKLDLLKRLVATLAE